MPNINLATIPFSTPMIRTGAGAEQWHNSTARIPNPTEDQPVDQENSREVYYRFQWARIGEATEGQYDFGYLDNLLHDAIDHDQKLSFGIMPYNSDGGDTSYDGASSAYPKWLHDKMQAEANPDWVYNGVWIANYNSQHYIKALRDLHTAIREHLLTGEYNGVKYTDAVFVIDIRGFGDWGEWHSGTVPWDNFPNGRQPTVSALKAIVDAHTQIFDRWPLVHMVAIYDGGFTGINSFPPYPELAHYALMSKNDWGDTGFRKDQYGDPSEYLGRLLEHNEQTYAGSQPFKNYILEKWKTAAITGEPLPGSLDMTDLMRQVQTYHTTSIGNGNYGQYPSSLATRDRIRAAFDACGYKLRIAGGTFTNTPSAISISLNWENGGIGVALEQWDVELLIKDSGGQIVETLVSEFTPFLMLPATVAAVDSIPLSVPPGDYSLAVRVVDPNGYREPMPLYNDDRADDGSYDLGSFNVSGEQPGENVPPVVDAGADIEITLPNNKANLTGSATDADGAVQTARWDKVSGSGWLRSPHGTVAEARGLMVGQSVFRLTATDNRGATASDDVTITVSPAETSARVLVDVSVITETTTVKTYSDGSSETVKT